MLLDCRSYRFKLSLWSLLLLAGHSWAEGQYCLSGGFGNQYSCAADKASGSLPRVYSVQLLANATAEQELSKRINTPVLDRVSVSEQQSFFYFGAHSTETKAVNALHVMKQQLGSEFSQHRPMLVTYARDGTSMARIRLVETDAIHMDFDDGIAENTPEYQLEDNTERIENNPTEVVANSDVEPALQTAVKASEDTSEKIKVVTQKTVSTLPVVELDMPLQPALAVRRAPFYTVQLGAFSTEKAQLNFAKKYTQYDIYCRQKNNGLYGTYLGLFESYSDASQYLSEVETFKRMKPYVLKLSQVVLVPCTNS